MNKFSFETINEFDNHISNSIMGYDLLHSLILNISSFFIKTNTVPVDLGCTSGKLMKMIQDKYNCKCIGYDIIENNFIEGVDLRKQDITDTDFIIPKTDVIYLIFTLQFIDVSLRGSILNKIYNSLNDNGTFVFCEKEICNNGAIQEVFTFSNYQNKKKNFTSDEILSKEFDLRKIMTPLNSDKNINLLKSAKFETIQPFFQSLNFKGYICKK